MHVGGPAPKPAVPKNWEPLLEELTKAGVKHSPERIVAIEKIRGRIYFLEQGNSRSGLKHILDQHKDDFARVGIEEEQIPDLLMSTIRTGEVVDTQRGRPIFELVYQGQKKRVMVTLGDNGYIVGANPG